MSAIQLIFSGGFQTPVFTKDLPDKDEEDEMVTVEIPPEGEAGGVIDMESAYLD